MPRVLVVLMLAAAGAWAQQPVLDRTGSTAKAPTTAVAREGCVTAECHPGIKAKPFLHGPVSVNGCEGCHKLTDEAKHTFEPLKSRQEMCALCHTPQEHPGEFVHEPVAKGDCLSCHDPHGSKEPKILRGDRYADSCAACHKDVTGAHDRVHGPASVGACGACHLPHASKLPKLLNAEGRELCLRCHLRTQIEIENKPVVHAPVLGDCGVCHDPHATDNPAILIENAATLCKQCHQDIAHTIETATSQHAAVTSKQTCLNCHAPHASDHPALLKNDVQSLCFECHNQQIALPDGTKLVNMKKLIETGKSLHGAITQKSCVECHDIHGGGHRRLLNSEYPADVYNAFSESSYALCFGCHDKALVQTENTNGATGFRNGTRNLHYVHVAKDKKGRTCKVCHDAHAASRDKHIRDEVAFGPAGWKLPIRYEPLADGGKCGAGCHAPLEYNRKEPLTYPAKPPGLWKGEDLVPGSREPSPPASDPNAPK